jgi:hypothetical protein
MLPSEKLELAIYKAVNRGPGLVTFLTMMPMLSQLTGENDHAAIAERLKALEFNNRIALSKYVQGSTCPRGDLPDKTFFYTGEFGIQIVPQGRSYFEELEQRAEHEAKTPLVLPATRLSEPLIFVSCGQSTPAERHLGQEIARLVEQETTCRAYFAENQASFEGVTENVLKTLHRAVGFIAIMHPRGNVSNPHSATEAPWVRGSVWVEQEIAIAAFIAQALQLPMRVRAYVHDSIRREGLREKLHLNPKIFRDDTEILKDLATLLPDWRSLAQQRLREPLSLKANIHHQRVPVPGGGDAERYLLMVNVENDGEHDATDFRLDVEFPGMFLDGGGHVAQKGTGKPGFVLFQVNEKGPQRVEHIYPSTSTPYILTFHYAIQGSVKRERPELLQERVTATVYSGDMRPKATSKTIAELMG